MGSSGINKVTWPSGEVTWPTSSVTSQLRPSTSPARILTRSGYAHTTQKLSQLSSSWVTWPLVVLLVLLHFVLCILSILQELDLLLMSVIPKERENSMVSLTALKRLHRRMVSRVSIKVSVFPSLVSSSIEHHTSVFSILVRLLLGDKPNILAVFALGQIVTVSAGIISYPLDTVRRRLMMTSGSKEKLYNGTIIAS